MDQNPNLSLSQQNNLPLKQQNNLVWNQKQLSNANPSDSLDVIQDFYSNINHDNLDVQEIPFNSNIFDSDCSIQQNNSQVASPVMLGQQYSSFLIHPLQLQINQSDQNILQPPSQANQQQQHHTNNRQQQNTNNRQYSYMPTLTFKALQYLAKQHSISFGSVAYYGKDINLQKQSQHVFYLILSNIILGQESRKRNKRFLMMVFNDVSQQLNSKIKAQKQLTPQHQFYFQILQEYGFKIINYVKIQLRDAFAQVMTNTFLRQYAFDQQFKVDRHIKQPIFYKYLLKVKSQLIGGRISGNVQGQQVEDILSGDIDL